MTALRDGQRVPGRAVGRATGLAVAVLLVLGTQWLASPGSIAAASGCPQGSTMNVVAHEDDDLLFLSPDLLHDVQGGLCVRTVFVTAGDAGNDADYWMSREAGSEAAYAEMAGVADIWTANDAGVAGHPMPLLTLNGLPRISLVFMRLPDGNLNGSGFGAYGNQSLQKLWLGQIGSVAAVDGSSGYSKNGLTGVLAQLMDDYQPDTIRTQDEVGEFGDGDHSDHHATAYFALAAHQQLTFAHQFISYADYETSGRTQNVFGADLTEKQDAYFTYARFDNAVCGSLDSCSSSDYGAWLGRQYVLDVQGSSPPPPPPPSGTNVAPLATASASSQNASTGQTALKAVDGSSEGYPADYSHEWATVGGRAGSWLQLTWASPVTLSRVVLYDRPNGSDQITAGSLVFSDGSSVAVGSLDNGGGAVTFTFSARTVTSLRLAISGVSASTLNIGLAELEAYGDSAPPPPTDQAPLANAGPDQSVAAGATVQLDGSASSDPDGDALSYAWSQTGGPTVSLSSPTAARPTFSAPSTTTSLTFRLIVNDGQLASSPDTVVISVAGAPPPPPPPSGTNVAPLATASASSQNASTGQTALKAVDGSSEGYPADYSHEWATVGGRAGSWLQLTWASPVTLSRVVLYDRPNGSDQITAGSLVFSDGSSVAVGSLDNGGGAVTFTFSARTVTSLRLAISGVSASTLNIGLAELEAYGP